MRRFGSLVNINLSVKNDLLKEKKEELVSLFASQYVSL